MSEALQQAVETRLREIGEARAAALGLEVVALRLGRAKKRWHVRFDVDRPGPAGVTLDDCQRMSEALSAELEERDVVPGSYVLEVSSPGIDRPIRTAEDVRRNTGRRVIVETREELDGRRSFRGVLVGLDGDRVTLREEGGEEIAIPLAGIAKARQEAAF